MASKSDLHCQDLLNRLREENDILRSFLENTEQGKEVIQQREEFSQLLTVSKLIISELNLEKVFQLVADQARTIVQAELVLVPMLNEQRDRYTYSAASGDDAEDILTVSFPVGKGMCGWVLRNERSLMFGASSPCWLDDKTAWEEGQQSAVLVPLFGRKQIIGGLSALGKKGGGSFTPHDLDLLTMFANQVSTAIENATMFHQLQGEIEERKQAERIISEQVTNLEQKNAELERFTYTVSHDLKSPLITIKGFLGTLVSDAREGRFDRMESDIGRISNATDKMQSLLNDLLSLSRIGRIINPPVEFAMTQVAQEAVELLHAPLQERKIELRIDDNMPTAFADKQRVREVLQNLVENAIKYLGDQPAPQIQIGYTNRLEGGAFFVKDNGIGVDPKYHQRIFGLFEKLDAGSIGTGIGLALVKRIIELHGGKIFVESTGNGQGATFLFTLPGASNERSVT